MTQPKEKGGVPPIEIYTIIGKGVDETDPVKKQDDENEEVRAVAAGHPNATKEHLDKALDDEDEDVRSNAEENLKQRKKKANSYLNN